MPYKASALVFLLFCISSASPAFATHDAEGWWKFDDGSGTTAADSGSGANAGTLTNTPTWVAGHIGSNALNFATASTEYVAIGQPAVLNFTGPFSISAWIKPSTLPSAADEFYTIVEKAYDSGQDAKQFI